MPVSVTPSTVTLGVGSSVSIQGSTGPSAQSVASQSANNYVNPLASIESVGTVSYESSDTSVATVSASGLVTGVKAGFTTIVVRAGNSTATCSVSVTAIPAAEPVVPAPVVLAEVPVQPVDAAGNVIPTPPEPVEAAHVVPVVPVAPVETPPVAP